MRPLAQPARARIAAAGTSLRVERDMNEPPRGTRKSLTGERKYVSTTTIPLLGKTDPFLLRRRGARTTMPPMRASAFTVIALALVVGACSRNGAAPADGGSDGADDSQGGDDGGSD